MKNTLIEKLFQVWLSSQTHLNEVFRWGRHIDANPKLRKQSTMAHVVSVSLVVSVALLYLKKYIPNLDDALVQRAFTLHDLPEGFRRMKRDTSVVTKTSKDDLKEYVKFEENFSHLPKEIYFELKKAYLLQFAEENSEIFPEEARLIMDYLWNEKHYEVLIFLALQRWEYIFYPLEAKKKKTHKHLLIHVLRTSIPHLRRYTPLIPGFREEIFTYDFEKYVKGYLKRNKHVPVF